jgi:small subunit ribosomal protein S4
MVQRRGRVKAIRRFGTPLPGLTRKQPREAAVGPGRSRAAGPGARRPAKKSDYGRRLEEKQKLRYHYGVTETQLRRAYEEARRRSGVTGHELLSLLERRLDNVVFRLGFAPTMPAARQLVSHGHILVNGRRVDIASQLVNDSEVVSVAERSRNSPGLAESAASGPVVALPSYLSKSPDDPFTGRLVGSPTREDVPLIVDDTAIVEFYAR